ncbi:amidohydrolase family protein [Streptomyces sp. MMCC 100]|uniref:amidohydrolase family protein n=1 Tax=Streptomyces sp. MMCC 100 TaxID=3163555 RepID=UPI00359A2B5B
MNSLMINATVWGGPECVPESGWVHLKDTRIADTGPGDPPPHLTEGVDRIIDLTGKHVLPGFVDVHTHVSASAWLPSAGDAADWTSLRHCLAQIRRDAACADAGEWLLYLNADPYGWSDEARLPRADELDEAAGGRPVVIACIDLHRGAVSSEVLSGLGAVTSSLLHPEDVVRGRRGAATGELYEAAFSAAIAMAQRSIAERLGDEGINRLLDREAGRHLDHGITHAHDPGVAPDAADALAELAGRTPLRLSWAAAPATGLLAPAPEAGQMAPGAYGIAPAEVKIFTDGADRCAVRLPPAAALRMVVDTMRAAARKRSLSPFSGTGTMRLADGHFSTSSALRYDDAELERVLSDHARAGHRVRIHALGNLAVDQVTRTVRRVGMAADSVTIEHLTLLSQADAAALAAVGAWASFQPGFLSGYAKKMTDTGIHQHLAVLGGRRLLDAGNRLILSSDQPCGPLDPLHNIRCAVQRLDGNNGAIQAEQALTVQEAVKASTTTAAASLFSPAAAGITAGAPADLAILNSHPVDDRCRVLSTWVGGEERAATAR